MLMAFIVGACGSSQDVATSKGASSEEQMKIYEAQFRPSDYDPDVKTLLEKKKEALQEEERTTSETAAPQAPETAPGFRVQVFSSTSIDEANAAKAEVESAFPDIWFYLVYDSPTYKIRAGDFLNRFEAERFAKQCSEKKYKDAWIVPDKIIKNPPPRPAPQPDQK